MTICDTCSGQSQCCFGRLPEKERELFLSLRRERYYARGTIVARQGEPAHGLFVNRSARLKLVHITDQGRASVVSVVEPGGVVGLAEIILGTPYLLSTEAIDAGEVGYVRKQDAVAFIRSNQGVALETLVQLSQAQQTSVEQYCNALGESFANRLHRVLNDFAATQGERCGQETRLSFHMTVQDLADTIGCSRQWTSRLLSDMEGSGLIRRDGRRIILMRERPAGVSSGE